MHVLLSSQSQLLQHRSRHTTFPANIRLGEDVSKTSWGRLSSSSSEDVLKSSSRRLDQDEYIHLTHTCSEDVFKTSSIRLDQDQYICLGHTSSRRLQDLFKRSSRRLAKTSSDVFTTSSRRLQDVLKTSSRHLQDILQRYLQGVFKTYHQVKLFLSTRLREYSTRYCKDGYLLRDLPLSLF